MRKLFVSLMAATAAALIVVAPAAASYGARSAPLLWEKYTWNDDTGSQSAAILNGGGTLTVDTLGVPSASTIASCDNASSDQPCSFGRTTVSPDGRRVVVSRHPQGSSSSSGLGPGVLELLDANGANSQKLRPLTASDTQPAFLPGGRRIVFTGRRTVKAPSQLYEVNVDGSGLRQLTFRGGSWAAPCANGAIVFDRGADLWLIPAHGSHWTRLVRGGSQPDCAPNSRQVVYARGHYRLALIGVNGRGGKLLPHGSGANEESDRPGYLSSPAFSPDGGRIAYLRSYDDLFEDGESYELDISDLRGRIHTRGDAADTVGGSYGADNDQSVTQYVSW
jgi:hypothetical protein